MSHKVDSFLHEFHTKLLIMRRIEGIIQSDDFLDVFEDANDDEQKEIRKLVAECDEEKLRRCIKRVSLRVKDIGAMSIRELRDRARQCGVRNYNTLTKGLLILEIRNAERNSGNAR